MTNEKSNPQILYTGDNEGPSIMRLDLLISNFNESGGWQFRHNESDMRHELDSRGWYEGLHDNGHYLVLNLDRMRLMPHPTLYDEPGKVHPDLGGYRTTPVSSPDVATTRSNYFVWIDKVNADAAQSAAGRFMLPRGFTVAHTGGGCLAWEKHKPDSKWSVWIVDEDAGLGDDLGDSFETSKSFAAMLQTDNGEFINGLQESTIAECIAWADSMFLKSDNELDAESEQ